MWQEFKYKYLVRFYSPLPSIVALSILSTYYFGLFGSVWAVTGEMTRWGGELLEIFGFNIDNYEYYKLQNLDGNPFTRRDGIMLIGMLIGCLIASLWSNNFKIRFPSSKIRFYQAFIGGILSGFGARLAMGCNLANFFTGIPSFSVHAWFFTLFMIIGIYCGNKIIVMPIFRSKAKLTKCNVKDSSSNVVNRGNTMFYIGSLVFISSVALVILIGCTTIFNDKPMPLLSIALMFGLAFGFIIARAQICFTSAFRDLFITGRSQMAMAVFIGMAVSSIGIFSYLMFGQYSIKMVWVGPNIVIGGFLFGLGIVIAGGCECGWMYRAIEGQVYYWIAGIGNIVGTIILALTWDYYSDIIATSWPKLNFLDMFGNYGGLIANYILLLFSLLAIALYSRIFLKNKLAT